MMKDLKTKIEIMQAALDGEEIEHKMLIDDEDWVSTKTEPNPDFNWQNLDYRIKTKPLEFWVNVFSTYPMKTYYLSKEEAELAGKRFSDYVKSIKVREVIDEQ